MLWNFTQFKKNKSIDIILNILYFIGNKSGKTVVCAGLKIRQMFNAYFKIFHDNSGFSYLSLMAIIVIIGISLSEVGYQWKTMAKREKEKELLFRGDAIRSAIIQYVNADPLKRYPHSLEDLLKNPNIPNPTRYLRKFYKDPMTGGEFLLITDPARGLVGVHSGSTEKPLKTSNFRVADRCFEEKKTYREWQFIVEVPVGIQPATAPAQGAAGQTNQGTPLPTALPCPPTNTLSEEKP